MLFSQHDELNLNNPGNVSNSKLSKLYRPRSSVKITAKGYLAADLSCYLIHRTRTYFSQTRSNFWIISHDILTCIFPSYVRINDILQKFFFFTFIMWLLNFKFLHWTWQWLSHEITLERLFPCGLKEMKRKSSLYLNSNKR